MTKREKQVLMLLAQGKKDHEIAADLDLTVKTVGNHVSHILSKLRMDPRTVAALWTVNEGFVETEEVASQSSSEKWGEFPMTRRMECD